MASYRGDGYEIEWIWKEVVVYWEGNCGIAFDAGWGVSPGVLYVPSAAIWAQIMPDWLAQRRDEVLGRLRAHSGHNIADEIRGFYRSHPERRQVTR